MPGRVSTQFKRNCIDRGEWIRTTGANRADLARQVVTPAQAVLPFLPAEEFGVLLGEIVPLFGQIIQREDR